MLKLPPDDVASRVGQLLEDRAAELDYRLKVQARRMEALLQTVAQLKAEIAKTGHTAES